jgi:hypothetical protein
VKLGVRQGGGGHGPNTIGMGGCHCLDREADEWAPAVLDFLDCPKLAQN